MSQNKIAENQITKFTELSDELINVIQFLSDPKDIAQLINVNKNVKAFHEKDEAKVFKKSKTDIGVQIIKHNIRHAKVLLYERRDEELEKYVYSGALFSKYHTGDDLKFIVQNSELTKFMLESNHLTYGQYCILDQFNENIDDKVLVNNKLNLFILHSMKTIEQASKEFPDHTFEDSQYIGHNYEEFVDEDYSDSESEDSEEEEDDDKVKKITVTSDSEDSEDSEEEDDDELDKPEKEESSSTDEDDESDTPITDDESSSTDEEEVKKPQPYISGDSDHSHISDIDDCPYDPNDCDYEEELDNEIFKQKYSKNDLVEHCGYAVCNYREGALDSFYDSERDIQTWSWFEEVLECEEYENVIDTLIHRLILTEGSIYLKIPNLNEISRMTLILLYKLPKYIKMLFINHVSLSNEAKEEYKKLLFL